MFRYFDELPKTVISNTAVTDITARNALVKTFVEKNSPYIPYVVPDGKRLENVAHDYYEDAYSVWLIYYANEIIDPYYDAPLGVDDFDAFINHKYGSYANAASTVAFWRNNWAKDTTVMDSAAYEALSANLKKYWKPVIDNQNSVTRYERARNNDILSTNKIVSLDVTETFPLDKKVTQEVGGDVVATGIVSFSNSSVCIVKHVTGTFETSEDETLSQGNTSSKIDGVTTIQTNIPDSEVAYWETVSFYDIEEENNKKRKSIYVVDKNAKGVMQRMFRSLMGNQ